MKSIVSDLRYALQRKALVNVYQANQDIVYTGYVAIIDDQGIILTTFDDSGIEDGAVYLTFGVIEFVEFDSSDLDSMQFRIENATEEHFVTYGQMVSAFDTKRPLIRQVLENSMVDESAVMVQDAATQSLNEGQVVRISGDDFDFRIFNKFDLGDRPKKHFSFDQVGLVEFEGKELTLQTVSMAFFDTMTPIPTKRISSLTGITEVLHQAQETQQLLSFNPVADEGMFFVGTVNTVTDDNVMVNLVDMTGQFGGYWLVRLNAIAQVTTQSDYLEVMQMYISIDQRLGETKQPGLNDERLFDATTDLFQTVLAQATKFHRVIRLQLKDDQVIVGYLSKLGDQQVIFHQVEQGTVIDPLGTLIKVSDIDEIAFDYLDAMLIEKQLRSQGDL